MQHGNWQGSAAEFGRRIPAPAILVAALVLLQISSGSSKIIMTADNALGLAFLRLLLGGILLWLVIRPDVAKFDRRQWLDVLLLAIAYAAFTLFFYAALARLPMGLVATVGFVGPLSVSLAGARHRFDFLWPLLAFAGVAILSPIGGASKIPWSSMAFCLGHAAAWGAYILASARAGRSIRGLDGFVVASVIVGLLAAPFGLSHAGYFLSSPYLIGMSLLVSLLIALPLSLEYLALKRLRARLLGVLLSLEPAIASIAGMLLLREFLDGSAWAAVAAVTVASVGASLEKREADSIATG